MGHKIRQKCCVQFLSSHSKTFSFHSWTNKIAKASNSFHLISIRTLPFLSPHFPPFFHCPEQILRASERDTGIGGEGDLEGNGHSHSSRPSQIVALFWFVVFPYNCPFHWSDWEGEWPFGLFCCKTAKWGKVAAGRKRKAPHLFWNWRLAAKQKGKKCRTKGQNGREGRKGNEAKVGRRRERNWSEPDWPANWLSHQLPPKTNEWALGPNWHLNTLLKWKICSFLKWQFILASIFQ
jgi:hypothetical protein